MTVVREIPSRSAMRDFGTPSAASLLISAQSSKVITLQSLSAHFSPPKLFSFRAPPTVAALLVLSSPRAREPMRRGGIDLVIDPSVKRDSAAVTAALFRRARW